MLAEVESALSMSSRKKRQWPAQDPCIRDRGQSELTSRGPCCRARAHDRDTLLHLVADRSRGRTPLLVVWVAHGQSTLP